MEKRRRWIRHSALVALVALTGCAHGDDRPDLAYVLEQDDAARVVAVKESGKELWTTSAGESDWRTFPVVWSPDGKRLAFVRGAQMPSPDEIVVIDADGSDERVVGEGTLPSWTSDSRSLVVERVGRPATIHVLSAEGGGERRLTTGSQPAVSHDGSRVAFVRNTLTSSELYTIALDGTGLRRLAHIRGRGREPLERRFVQPLWLPDDSAVAVLEPRGTFGGPLMAYSLESDRRVLARGGIGAGGLASGLYDKFEWSPAGDLLAYARDNALYVVRREGAQVHAFPDSYPIDIGWSPDGRKLAFSKLEVLETGQFIGLYLIDLDSKEPRRFVTADGDAAYVAWRPKG
jgi:Tol biopolymer transport system component